MRVSLNDTKLSDPEEQGYRGWLSRMGQAPGMGNLDKEWNHKSFDLRGVYKKYGPVDLRHAKIPDEFKKSEDLSKGPDETQNNWAKKGSDSMGSRADVTPWLNTQSGGSANENPAGWMG